MCSLELISMRKTRQVEVIKYPRHVSVFHILNN